MRIEIVNRLTRRQMLRISCMMEHLPDVGQ